MQQQPYAPPAPNFAAPGQAAASPPQQPAAPQGYHAPPAPAGYTQPVAQQQGYGPPSGQQPQLSAPPPLDISGQQQGAGFYPQQGQQQQAPQQAAPAAPTQQPAQSWGPPQAQQPAQQTPPPPAQQGWSQPLAHQNYAQPATQQGYAPQQQQQLAQGYAPQQPAGQFAPPAAQAPAPAQGYAPQQQGYRPPGQNALPTAGQQLAMPGYQQPGGGRTFAIKKPLPPLDGTFLCRLVGAVDPKGKAPPKLEFRIEDPAEAQKAAQQQVSQQGREVEVPLWNDERSLDLVTNLGYGVETWVDQGDRFVIPIDRMLAERPLAQITFVVTEGDKPGRRFSNVDSVRRVG